MIELYITIELCVTAVKGQSMKSFTQKPFSIEGAVQSLQNPKNKHNGAIGPEIFPKMLSSAKVNGTCKVVEASIQIFCKSSSCAKLHRKGK